MLWHQQSFFTSRWETVSRRCAAAGKHPDSTARPRGAARLNGQIAFAEAARRRRGAAFRAAARTMRYNPAEPRTLLAAAVAVGVPSELVIRTLHNRGRGI